MKCPQCQTLNKDGAKFCNECGCTLTPSRAASSGPLSEDAPVDPRAALKSIPHVEPQPDEAAAAFAAEEDVPEFESVSDIAREMFPNRYDSGQTARVSVPGGADVTADLRGLEKLVDSSYVPPAYSGRAGDTVEMPAVRTEAQQSRDFRAQLSDKERKRLEKQRKKEERKGGPKMPLVIALVLVIAAAAIAFATYYFEMWGGKSVPDVIGQSQENATYTLESKGFEVRPEYVKSDDVAGIVLLTDPGSGGRAEAGAEIVMHISESRIVPDVVGKTQDEAKALLDEQGFDNYLFIPVKSNEQAGVVLGINVETGVRALSTTPIEIEVAEPYTVPEVKGMSEEEALAALEAEGYSVTVRPHYTEEEKEGLAVSTEPAAGIELKSGEKVTLYVTKSRGSELTDLTWSYLASSTNFSLDGLSYEVSSVDSVDYIGEDTVQYVMTARYYETHYWFGIEAETRYGEYESITGTITWNDSNEIVAADPTIKKI